MRQFIPIITMFLLLLLPFDVSAKKSYGDIQPTDQFSITFVNTSSGTIKIGKNTCTQHSTFVASSNIYWSNNPLDFIEAKNLRTKIKYRISSKAYKKANATSINDFVRKKYTCDKGGEFNFIQIGEYLSRYPWEMIDEVIEIPLMLPFDKDQELLFSPINITSKNKTAQDNIWFYADEYDLETGCAYLTKEKLQENGISIDDLENISFHVEYFDGTHRRGLTDNFTIIYLPKQNQ